MTGPVLPVRKPLNSAAPIRTPSPPPVSGTAETPVGRDRRRESGQDATNALRADIARVSPNVTVITLVGEVDVATSDVLASALAGAVSACGAGGRVVLELNRVTFLGACGLGVILAAQGDASRRDGEVVMVVDDVAPAARSLQFLPLGRGSGNYSTLTAAIEDRKEVGDDQHIR